MKLPSLFTSVTPEQFKPSSQVMHTQLLEAFNAILDQNPQITGADNLVALHAKYPEMFNSAMKVFHDQDYPFCKATYRLDFQAAWLLDGGYFNSIAEYAKGDREDYLKDLAENCIEHGGHHAMLLVAYKDAELTLKGVAKVLTNLFHPSGSAYKEVCRIGTSLERTMLGSLEKSPAINEFLVNDLKHATNWFYPGCSGYSGREEQPNLKKAVVEVYNHYLQNVSTADNALHCTLNALVYNPHLKMKFSGETTIAVATSATEVIKNIVSYLSFRNKLKPGEDDKLAYFAFQNLFSPFVAEAETLGVFKEYITGDKQGDQAARSFLASTLQGPLGSFSGRHSHNDMAVIAEGLENLGASIDLDRAICSELENHEGFYALVKYKGTSDFLEGLLQRFVSEGVSVEGLADFLSPYVSVMDFENLPDEAKIGYLGIVVNSYRNGNWWEDPSTPETHIAKKLECHPNLVHPLLELVQRNDQLDAKVLKILNVGLEALNEFGLKDNEKIKEEFLAQDLGL